MTQRYLLEARPQRVIRLSYNRVVFVFDTTFNPEMKDMEMVDSVMKELTIKYQPNVYGYRCRLEEDLLYIDVTGNISS